MNENPLVTFAVLAFNQEKYIREAVNGALSQTYRPLEVIISDDCSVDNTFKIIREIISEYDGVHEVIVRQNQDNQGLIQHVNYITSIMKGEILVMAAGDDISIPNRTNTLVSKFVDNPKAQLVHSEVTEIAEDGDVVSRGVPPLGTKYEIENLTRSTGLYIGATGAIRKVLPKYFGPITYKNTYEDQIYGFRAALIGEIEFIEEELVKYRLDVGISSSSLNYLIGIKERRKYLAHRIETFMQRKLDLDKSKHPKFDNLNEIIIHEITLASARSELYDENLHFWCKFLSLSFRTYFNALLIEGRYLIKLVLSKFKKIFI